MRYKNLVMQHLEQVEQKLRVVVKGMENNVISSKDAYDLLMSVQSHIEEIKEKVELEPDAR